MDEQDDVIKISVALLTDMLHYVEAELTPYDTPRFALIQRAKAAIAQTAAIQHAQSAAGPMYEIARENLRAVVTPEVVAALDTRTIVPRRGERRANISQPWAGESRRKSQRRKS